MRLKGCVRQRQAIDAVLAQYSAASGFAQCSEVKMRAHFRPYGSGGAAARRYGSRGRVARGVRMEQRDISGLLY
jgi:hypothetical protein